MNQHVPGQSESRIQQRRKAHCIVKITPCIKTLYLHHIVHVVNLQLQLSAINIQPRSRAGNASTHLSLNAFKECRIFFLKFLQENLS